MRFPHGFTVTVERPSGTDRHGNPLPPTTHTAGRCALDRTDTVELVDGQQTVITSYDLLVDDPAADIKPTDVLLFPDGTRWQVRGDADRPRNPFTGWAPGMSVPIERA